MNVLYVEGLAKASPLLYMSMVSIVTDLPIVLSFADLSAFMHSNPPCCPSPPLATVLCSGCNQGEVYDYVQMDSGGLWEFAMTDDGLWTV